MSPWSMRGGALFAFIISSVAAFVPGSLADDAKARAYGQHLSRECTTCHRIDGTDNGIPSIVGWPAEEFVTTMQYYKEKLRPNEAMQSVAQSLEDEDFRALALYFGSLPKPAKKR